MSCEKYVAQSASMQTVSEEIRALESMQTLTAAKDQRKSCATEFEEILTLEEANTRPKAGRRRSTVLKSRTCSFIEDFVQSGLNIEAGDLNIMAQQMKEGLEIKDRRFHLRTFKQCFLASDAVEWFIKMGITKNEELAVELGLHMQKQNLLYHVTRDADFVNKPYFFRLASQDSRGAHNVNKKGQPISWSEVHDIDSINGQPISNLLSEIEISPMDSHNIETLNNVHPASWKNPVSETRIYTMVVIGGGAAGLVCAASAVGVGCRVALIERHLMGGDCLNTGCVPSKALLRAARAAKEIRDASRFGIHIDDGAININFGETMERLRRIRASISSNDSCERFTRVLGIDVYQGQATFVDRNKVQIGEQILTFHRAVIATGGRARILEVDGIESVPYLTNSELFNLTDLPPRICIIGAGPVGLEMAQAFARFGAEVTCLLRGEDLLPREDREAADVLEEVLEEEGVEFLFNVQFTKIVRNEEGGDQKYCKPFNLIDIHVQVAEESHVVQCEALLVALGRSPNVEDLGLEEAHVEYSLTDGVLIDEYMQSTNPDIYAVGDVCSRYKFTHMADHMARAAIRNALFFGYRKHTTLLVPWTTYTCPEVAHVGMYPDDMDAKHIQYDTYRKDFSTVDRALCDEETRGFVKIHVKKGSDEIYGATIVNENAGNMISEITLAMQHEIGLGMISETIHPYPTHASAIPACGDQYNKTKLTPLIKGFLGRVAGRRTKE